MIHNSLFIGGNRISKDPSNRTSPFYPEYRYEAAQAGPLEVAEAIGRARRAERGSLAARSTALRRAAERYRYTDETVEHTVRMTGVPLSVAADLLENCRHWLKEIPDLLAARYGTGEGQAGHEKLSPGLERLLIPEPGFCYAVTPGNDPRSAALVAANLCYLGIPFIIKASNSDAVALLVIQALIDGGFDPNFCSLLYFDNERADQHHKLVASSTAVWTFGPQNRVDPLLRYVSSGRRAVIDLPPGKQELEPALLRSQIGLGKYHFEEAEQDLFEGKQVLRHDSGNCVAICRGPFNESGEDWLYEAIRYPQGCTAVKSVMVVNGGNWVEASSDFLSVLRTGDPLDSRTQVGYCDPCALDYLDSLIEKHRLRATFYGGERISPIQARPLLVAKLDEAAQADFLADEIPAYVLTLQACEPVEAAISEINRFTPDRPRLAVSLFNLTETERQAAIQQLRAHAVLIDRPSSRIVPIFHEGNDYANKLSPGRIVVS